MLGVDDYLTKPINEDDLMATISGKIKRSKKMKEMNAKLQTLIESADLKDFSVDNGREGEDEVLIRVDWNDVKGPEVVESYPQEIDENFPLEEIGSQLFNAATSMYGQDSIKTAEGVLLNMKNIQYDGYALFDAYPDKTFRGGEKQYMLAVIAPRISYLQSLQIKSVLKRASLTIKENRDWNIENTWIELNPYLRSTS